MNLYKIVIKADKDGVSYNTIKYTAIEKKTTYWLMDGTARRIHKDRLLVVNSNLRNDLNSPLLTYYTYSLNSKIEEGKQLLLEELTKTYEHIKNNVNIIGNGLLK